jgi:hypothetical protein
MPRINPGLVLSTLLLAAVSCVGTIAPRGAEGAEDDTPASKTVERSSATPGSNESNAGPASSTSPVVPLPRADTPSSAPLRRLTREQYNNTVRDLLGISSDAAAAFSPDERDNGFDTNATVAITDVQVEQYQQGAETLAQRAQANLKALAPCAPPSAAQETTCAGQFIRQFGKRAYRRPLEAAEVDGYQKLFAVGRSAGDFSAGLKLVIQAMLQSPHFLYRVELGAPSTAADLMAAGIPFSAHEMASRMSYLLWNTMPDDALFAAAEANMLGTTTEIVGQAARMLRDQKTKDMLSTFHEQWLDARDITVTEKNRILFPMFDPTLRAVMRTQAQRFVNDVVLNGDGRLETLLTARYSFVSGPLYSFLGLSAPPAAQLNQWQRIELSQNPIAGLLTMPAVLAVHAHEDQTSLVKRGAMIRAKLLCTIPPPPPKNVDATPPKIDPNISARRRFEQHRANPVCASCHALMDPLGAPFELFDAIGRYRTMDGKEAVDSSGSLTGTANNDGPVTDPADLAHKLILAQEVHNCMAKQLFRFAFSRSETDGDGATLGVMQDAFTQSQHRIPDLLMALVASRGFRNHKAPVLQ